jgi:hypothetical protein
VGTIVSKPSKKWMAFWAAIMLTAAGGETVAIVANGGRDSFSAQIWYILGLNSGLKVAGAGIFVAGAVWLFHHFFFKAP